MKKQDSPGWIGTSPRVTAQRNSLAGRIGSSTRPGTTHNADTGDKKTTAASTRRPACIEPKKKSATNMEQRGRHHRTEEGQHCAGPNAAMLLHPHWPPDGMKNTESEATQRAGASPHPSLDTLSRARGPPTRRTVVWTSLGPLPRWVPGPTTR
jgi:hypothetical protein